MPTNDALDPAQLPAGPALDAAVQRAVWSSDLLRIPTAGEPHHWVVCIEAGKVQPIPPYSSSIEAAMTLLDDWQDYDIQRRNDWFTVELYEPSREYRAHAETLPLAICRAVLSAVAMASEGERGGR
jgi:hypothetical protein